jgi:hypothetical protein
MPLVCVGVCTSLTTYTYIITLVSAHKPSSFLPDHGTPEPEPEPKPEPESEPEPKPEPERDLEPPT